MSKLSLESIAYTNIRQKIVSCEYLPGTVLSENELAIEFNMSRTPIRSALSRLESEGFIVSFNKRGILVKDISHKELIHIYESILALQLYVLDQALLREYAFDTKKLKTYLDIQIEASQNNDYKSYIENSVLFRRTVISAADNDTMLMLIDSYKDKVVMKSLLHWKQTPHLQHYSANRINQSVYDSILQGNYGEAKQSLVEAFERILYRTAMDVPGFDS
ncbi:GntR family transcriptional regulator [Paenibacillus alba]|uniref:GntR family transcriptional regulator n=1 Tax=Paenibacillus alba TaxID=1197127 RepID=A0ABU6G5B6_9BACL|nr:GntR family transcriptional regulator [Paenibacillus alba]MEC0229355.1 GntR family transcriptional regulator [Paenibacillus alba]